ncbi:MAG: hypothetical protein ABJM06_09360 [Gilvibacter sp.]
MEELTLDPRCTNCEEPIMGKPKFCVNCGFPENGTEQEKSKFIAEKAILKSKQKEAPKRIKSARNTLFIVGGWQMLSSLVIFFLQDDMIELIAGAVVFVIFLLLGFWSQKKPLIALILGLLVYLTLIGLGAIGDPSSLAKGIIIKVVIIAFLAKGINSALELRKKPA